MELITGTPGTGIHVGTPGTDIQTGTPGTDIHTGTPGTDIHTGTPGTDIHTGTPGADTIQKHVFFNVLQVLIYPICRGLCGIFDGDPTNDLHDQEGRILDVTMQYGQVNKFAQEWR